MGPLGLMRLMGVGSARVACGSHTTQNEDDGDYENETRREGEFALPSQQLVRIDVNAYLHIVRKGKAVDHFSDRSREPEDGSGTQQDLEPIKTFHPFDLSGDDRMKRHRRVNLLAQTAGECLRREFSQSLVLRFYLDQNEMIKGRIVAVFPEFAFLVPKTIEIMVPGELDRGTEWRRCLHKDFTWGFTSAGPPGYLGQ